jgi:hypothetical protein
VVNNIPTFIGKQVHGDGVGGVIVPPLVAEDCTNTISVPHAGCIDDVFAGIVRDVGAAVGSEGGSCRGKIWMVGLKVEW